VVASPEHLTKRQKKYQHKEVSHVCVGKVFKTEWSHIPITFTEADLKLKRYPQEDPIVIRVVLGRNTKYLLGNDVGGILVDNGSSADIITYELFKRMEFRDDQLQKTSKPLYGFDNKKVEDLGTIEMNVSLGTGALMRTKMVTFDLVDIPIQSNLQKGNHIKVCGSYTHDREYNVGSNQKLIHVDGNNEDMLESEEEEEPEELEMKKRFFQDEKKRMQPHEHTKKVRLCKYVHDNQ
jgi:hypothetical protein